MTVPGIIIGSPTTYALSKNDLTSQVYFDLMPNPTPAPIPERMGSSETTLMGISGGVLVPGKAVRFDMGFDVTNQEVELELVKVTQATYNSLFALYQNVATVYFTPNSFTNYYELSWQPGKSFDLTFVKGTGVYEGPLKFFFVKQVK